MKGHADVNDVEPAEMMGESCGSRSADVPASLTLGDAEGCDCDCDCDCDCGSCTLGTQKAQLLHAQCAQCASWCASVHL